MRSKSPKRLPVAASLFLVLAASAAVHAVTILKVAATEDDETYPSVSGNTVVWQSFNSRYDDWDIAGAVISNGDGGGEFHHRRFPGRRPVSRHRRQ